MLQVLAGLLTMATFTSSNGPGAADDRYLETIQVAENIYVFKPRIELTHGNGVAIIGPDGVFFIDTYLQFNYAEEAVRRLKRITKLPVRYVLNTHWHNDHVMGNGVFKRAFPQARFIAHDSTAAYLTSKIKSAVEGEKANIAEIIAATRKELEAGKTPGGVPLVGTLKSFDELSLREAEEYQRQFHQEAFVGADVTFSDSLTIRWGAQTLRLIHLGQRGHSAGDVIVWIPETRLLIAGDIVVAPTPYATYPNTLGLMQSLEALIAMNPATIIPGHGPVMRDVSYLQLLTRTIAEYRRATEVAIAAKVPARQAMDSLVRVPEIDRLIAGDDPFRQWTFRGFFVSYLVYNMYKAAGALPPPTKPG